MNTRWGLTAVQSGCGPPPRNTLFCRCSALQANSWGLAHAAPMVGARLVLPGELGCYAHGRATGRQLHSPDARSLLIGPCLPNLLPRPLMAAHLASQ